MNKFLLSVCFVLSSMIAFSSERSQARMLKYAKPIRKELKISGGAGFGCAAAAPTKKMNMFNSTESFVYRLSAFRGQDNQ